MAKDKERSVNPAQQQRKAEKAKALKKSKAELQTRRNEKLAKRNPDRIQKQIDDLKALEGSGDIKPREKAILADLERDLKAVNKAREAVGGKAPAQVSANRQTGPPSALGKRRHDGERKHHERRNESGSDTDESVRNIPWPRDTPPPIPREFRRRNQTTNGQGSIPAPVIEAQTTYESAPQVRDLKKEAINRFVPVAVKKKQDAIKGQGGQLLEPDEMDRLEKEGYIRNDHDRQDVGPEDTNQPKFSEYNPRQDDQLARLRAEEEAFEKELNMRDASDGEGQRHGVEFSDPHDTTHPVRTKQVEMEEVEDDGS